MISSLLSLAVIGGFLIPGIIIAAVIALLVLGMVVASRYKTVPPNAIAVFFGRKYKVRGADGSLITRGFDIMTGGGRILLPIVEQYQVMSTAAFQVVIEEESVPTLRNVPVRVKAVATCRISPNPDEQSNAVQAFLGKPESSMASTVNEILRGHVRSIIASLAVEQILRDRAEFNQKVLQESAEEFRKLGIQIVTLVVQDVTDEVGYIAALGKQETAAKIRDAAIATAQAEKETKVKVSDAQREAAEVAAQNAVKVADAEKIRDVQVAQFRVETEGKRAEADMANQIAKTTQETNLRVLEAKRDAQAAEAGIVVQEKRAALKQKELQATIIVEAEAKRQAQIIASEAAQEVAQRTAKQLAIEADGKANAAIRESEGIARKTQTIAAADADATRVRMAANAEGTRATGLAEADSNRAQLLSAAEGNRMALLAAAEGEEKRLLAIANGKKAALLGEAAGTRELAEALKQLSEQGRLIMILDRLPTLLEKGGDAGAKIVSAAFEPLGKSLGAIKNVSIVDMGGSEKGGGVAKFAGSIPQAVAAMVANAEAIGIDVKPLLKLAKIDASKLQSMIGLIDTAIPAETQPANDTSAPSRN
jgi:flotillin